MFDENIINLMAKSYTAVDNSNLQSAKTEKNDEFYTLFETIEEEVSHYGDYFKGKTVYCNCDNPLKSNFWAFFHTKFTELGLKGLISTYYGVDAAGRPNTVLKTVYEGGNDADVQCGTVTQLMGDGDFRSMESVALLQQADVVVTNPPFSLFRDFVTLMNKYNKSFLILGNMNAVTCKEIFPLFKNGKLWYGATAHSSAVEFQLPECYTVTAKDYRVDEDGRCYVKVSGIRWFTNIEHDSRDISLELTVKYSPTKHPKYENAEAINVDKTSEIPYDYDSVMGVPISFLDSYNPKQFIILGLDKEFTRDKKRGIIGGKQLYARIFIRRRREGE